MPQSPLEEFVGAMTLSELADRSGKSVSDIIAWALPGKAGGAKAPRPAPKKAAPKAAAGGGKSKVVNTRTPEGRAAYDEAVLQAVGSFKSPAGSSQLRKKVGGTPLQMRTALNRLIDEKKVTYEGKARATRYSLR